jgi:phospholipid/cholesterol/gamma-HCH transport system substrate-binding protein
MKFSIRFADKIVGTLVVLALAILVFVIFMLGRSQRWFMQDFQYKTYLTSASGIRKNMDVLYKGFTIGHVKDLSLSEDSHSSRVEVIFTIFEEYNHRVKVGSLVEIQNSPIPGFGNAFIFHPGRGDREIPVGSFIPEISSPEAQKYINDGSADVPQSTDNIGNILNHVNTLLENINLSLAGSDDSEEPVLGQLLSEIRDAVANINPVLAQFSSPEGTVMSLLDGQGAVYNSLESTIVSISQTIENLNQATAFLLPQLPQIAVLISEVNTALRTSQDVLIAVANNPLLRGGIPERIETGPGGASPRNLDF